MAPNFEDTQRGKECSPGVTPLRIEEPHVHARVRYNLWFLATIIKPDHVCRVLYFGHACGGFSRLVRGWCLSPRRALSSLVPHCHHNGRIIWTEPVKYQPEACLLACLNHTVPSQIIEMSLTRHSNESLSLLKPLCHPLATQRPSKDKALCVTPSHYET